MVSGFESNNKSQLKEIDHRFLSKFEQNILKDTPHKLILWVGVVSDCSDKQRMFVQAISLRMDYL